VQDQGNPIAVFFHRATIATSKKPWGTQICGHPIPRSCARRSSRYGIVETAAWVPPSGMIAVMGQFWLSVIIPSHNGERWLAAAPQSLVDQKEPG
jgi:hypothetical protein